MNERSALSRACSLGACALLMLAAVGCGPAASSSQAEQAADSGQSNASAQRGSALPKQGVPEAIARRTRSVAGPRIQSAEPANWLAHGRTYGEQRFSPLESINTGNVSDLGLAWRWDTGTKRGLEASPIVVDGVMYTTGSWSVVYAHDARTGRHLWTYDPEVPRAWGVHACCDVVNRGVAVWKGRVYVGTLDGRLVALDAATGEPVWKQLTIDRDKPYTITGAPRIVKGNVIIGNGGAEYGVRGYITAYDAETGERQWRFYTVPGNPEQPQEGEHLERAVKTWRGGTWWEAGGGGTAWDSMAYDPELDLLYVGTGNGSPWNRYVRSPGGGDNLYLSSIIALDPDDGSMAWYYQTTPGDAWDYTATQHMILADLEINGERRKALVQAPKNGFFYVLDRTDGELLSAEPYVPVTWAEKVDLETGRPVENPNAHYINEAKITLPGPYGGHNWHPMSYSPETGLVYIPALQVPFVFGQQEGFSYDPNPKAWNTGLETALNAPVDDPADELAVRATIKGSLVAWDPVAQKAVWRVQHAGAWNGGTLATAGNLVFQGRADGHLAAYRASDGKLLWETPTYTGVIAPPVTYAVDGEQYLAVMAGWGGAFGIASGVPAQAGNQIKKGRLLVYKLGGDASLPEPDIEARGLPEPPPLTADAKTLAHGEDLFQEYCSVCHGNGAVGSGVLPDLRYASHDVHQAWEAIVLDGAYRSKGMVAFDHALEPSDAQAIRQYVIKRAQDAREMARYQRDQQAPQSEQGTTGSSR